MTKRRRDSAQPHRVVIVGAGFAGLEAAFRLASAPVSITLVEPSQPPSIPAAIVSSRHRVIGDVGDRLADPLSAARSPEVTTLFATVTGVDAAAKRVLLDDGDGLPYDTLILATGARHAYFGPHDEWEPFAPGLKTLEERHHAAAADSGWPSSGAERETDPQRRDGLADFWISAPARTGSNSPALCRAGAGTRCRPTSATSTPTRRASS